MTKETDILNLLSSDTFQLVSQFKYAHWNIKSTSFQSLHLLFDSIASLTYDQTDRLSERIKAFNDFAYGVFLPSRLSFFPVGITDEQLILNHLLHILLDVVENVETAIPQVGQTSSNILQDISKELGQQIYFIRQHIKTIETNNNIPNYMFDLNSVNAEADKNNEVDNLPESNEKSAFSLYPIG
jgi:starvation-inducible DNA-binding protein